MTRGRSANILGRDWFDILGIQITGVNSIIKNNSLKNILIDYENIFSDELGKYSGQEVKIEVDKSIRPVKMSPRKIPFD